jgi:hypothetical protein
MARQSRSRERQGLWSDNKFLTSSSELNPKLTHVQIADFHGHNAIEVRCEDCHGSYTKYTDFLATRNAGTEDGNR